MRNTVKFTSGHTWFCLFRHFANYVRKPSASFAEYFYILRSFYCYHAEAGIIRQDALLLQLTPHALIRSAVHHLFSQTDSLDSLRNNELRVLRLSQTNRDDFLCHLSHHLCVLVPKDAFQTIHVTPLD